MAAAAMRLLLLAVCALAAGARAGAAAQRGWAGADTSACPAAANATREPIGMWGCAGEAWRAGGPLSDWSFAGYGAGLEAIPDAPVAVDVRRDFEAAGDGVTDDTAAVLAALKATQAGGGVIFFPPGRYLLRNKLNISSNQVLRGAGRDATTLLFNTSLQQLYGWGPRWRAGQEASPYTWSGALISTQRETYLDDGWRMRLADVAAPARRGERRLRVAGLQRGAARADALFVRGAWLALRMFENGRGDLAHALCNRRAPVGADLGRDFGGGAMLTHASRILAAGDDWVELERPLPVDVDLEFKPTLVTCALRAARCAVRAGATTGRRLLQADAPRRAAPRRAAPRSSQNFKVTGVGVEDLTVEFPWTPYLGHHEEPGYNAIEFEAATNSWVRRVRIINADSGIKLYSSIFNTVSDIEVGTSPKPRRGGRWYGRDEVMQDTDKDGHMAIALHWACFDNLVERFNITPIFYHELLVAGYSAHNVFSNGTGTDVCLDHHGGAPHNNLWTDIDLGSGQAAMRWSGAPQHFPFAGSNNTFWNVWASAIPPAVDYAAKLAPARAADTAAARLDVRRRRRATRLPVMSRPASIQGYGQVVVDMPLDANQPAIREAGDWLVLYSLERRVWPANLHAAMRATQAQRLQLAGRGDDAGQQQPGSVRGGAAPVPAPPISQLLPALDAALRAAQGRPVVGAGPDAGGGAAAAAAAAEGDEGKGAAQGAGGLARGGEQQGSSAGGSAADQAPLFWPAGTPPPAPPPPPAVPALPGVPAAPAAASAPGSSSGGGDVRGAVRDVDAASVAQLAHETAAVAAAVAALVTALASGTQQAGAALAAW
ncbi:hypothetical protein HT031_004501 [Scenedesmus sp. PABB004]|nr:hypothetical protein HT031_004501 [Scenedesmus sp. PABB004]